MPHGGIGEQLRAAREARGLPIEALVAVTKIRQEYLEAIEEERLGDLPPRAFARGYVRSYALALGLDPEPFVEAFDRTTPIEVRATRLGGAEVPIRPAHPASPLRRMLTLLALAVLVAAVVVGVVAYVQVRQFEASRASPPPEQPAAPAPAVPAAPVPTTPEPPAPEPPAPSAPAAAQGVTVEAATSAPCWVRVTADGRQAFQGLLRAGERRTWRAERAIVLRIGNAGGIALTVNGRALGPLGRTGEVVERTFSATAP